MRIVSVATDTRHTVWLTGHMRHGEGDVCSDRHAVWLGSHVSLRVVFVATDTQFCLHFTRGLRNSYARHVSTSGKLIMFTIAYRQIGYTTQPSISSVIAFSVYNCISPDRAHNTTIRQLCYRIFAKNPEFSELL